MSVLNNNAATRVERIVKRKVSALREDGVAPRVLDLFSGCGGLFLGFQRAGCVSVAGVEIDPIAARSFARNFHGDAPAELFAEHAASKDITAPENAPHKLLSRLGHRNPEHAVDFVVGGPPCPAFARVGRAKLREIHEHPEAFRHDPRAKLYLPYLAYVEALAPVALVMENVPDILNFGGHNLAEEICEALQDLGYDVAYTLLNAANYGVPQMRERFFLVGVHSAARTGPAFPTPTHKVVFPSGYKGSRQVALKHLDIDGLFPQSARFVRTPLVPSDALPAVTAQDALADLPRITAHLKGDDKRGARRFDKPVPYRADVAPSSYAAILRAWKGFESKGVLLDHVTRSLSPRDYRLFKNMRAGDEYPEAHALAVRLFEAVVKETGQQSRRTKAYAALRASFVPPYDPSKFPNKWRKMEKDAPARTLMAHLGKDTYSHIHYDSSQARVITVREAARLQSFPDGFAFEGTMNPAFRQIGNSVPPLMAFALASTLIEHLGAGKRTSSRATTGAAAVETSSGLGSPP